MKKALSIFKELKEKVIPDGAKGEKMRMLPDEAAKTS